MAVNKNERESLGGGERPLLFWRILLVNPAVWVLQAITYLVIFKGNLLYFMGMVTNYLLNKYFNFRNKSKQIVMQFGLFAIVALVGLGINQFLLYSLVEFAKLWYISAKIIAIFIGLLWSFYGHKKLTFNVFWIRNNMQGVNWITKLILEEGCSVGQTELTEIRLQDLNLGLKGVSGDKAP